MGYLRLSSLRVLGVKIDEARIEKLKNREKGVWVSEIVEFFRNLSLKDIWVPGGQTIEVVGSGDRSIDEARRSEMAEK